MDHPLIEFRAIGKQFFGVEVLRSISFMLQPGRVLGLVGENGAGKSTLMNILGGVVAPDAGSMLLRGTPYAPGRPRDATAAGIAFVHQELNLFTNLSIAENLQIDSFPRRMIGKFRLPLIDYATFRSRASALLEQVYLRRDPNAPVSELSPGERQVVEIAKALGAEASLIILDEPTTSLTMPEARRLFDIIQRLRRRGVAIIYISHRLEDVLTISDDIVVLRDGQVVSTGIASAYSSHRLIQEMIGREVDQLFSPRPAQPPRHPLLRVEHITEPGVLSDISFTLHKGEVLGIAGLMGAGRTELARALFGLDTFSSGQIRLDDEPFTPSPRESIRRGLALLTENRREEGLLMDDSVLHNASLVALPQFIRTPLKFIARLRLARRVAESTQATHLRAANLARQTARTLSGGNQQKVVLAKWLMNPPSILILDEPTRGIDVGAKQEVYRIINALVAQGAAILLISSEIEELIGTCDRIMVMAAGRIVRRLDRTEFDRHRILRAALNEEVAP